MTPKKKVGHDFLGNAREVIRAAERQVAAGDYELALQQLSAAREMEPSNQYIRAIIDRVVALRGKTSSSDVERSKERYLTVTIGNEFTNGIKPPEADDEPASEKELQARVLRLTSLAAILWERGSYETAFDSLMKAYLLDPTSPAVIACEKNLLPSWEQMQKNRAAAEVRATPLQEPPPSEQMRIDALVQQKDLERTERERAMWREASAPPRIFVPPEEGSPDNEADTPPPAPSKSAGGFFSKLRQGRFLG
jgi:tetratricopeptide (TPR) repeat protein